MLKTLTPPVIFIIFNRPAHTARVFEKIRQARPSQLFVVADGARPNHPEDQAKCLAARQIINKVDWSCKVYKNYSEVNLGCGHRVSSGISWAFSHIEEAIILEDDCLPCESFFYFCDQLLSRYKNDHRIMHISGPNYLTGNLQKMVKFPYSYGFSRYGHVAGWATWRRAWKHFDYNMSSWPEFRNSKKLKNFLNDPIALEIWTKTFDNYHADKINAWGARWLYTVWKNNGLHIYPSVNLISNIGWDKEGTSTKTNSPLANIPTKEINQLFHPPEIKTQKDIDTIIFEYLKGGKELRWSKTLRSRIYQGAKRLMTALLKRCKQKQA